MLSNISKIKLVERAKNTRVVVKKESLSSKKKAPANAIRVQSEQDEHTTSGLFFKRKRLQTVPPPSTRIQMAGLLVVMC